MIRLLRPKRLGAARTGVMLSVGSSAALVFFANVGAVSAGDDPPPSPAPREEPSPPPATTTEPEKPAADADPADDKRAESEAHFRKGRQFVQAKAWSQALAEFIHARQLFPSWGAMSNAAACLENLQRYDEALDMVEALLREFEGKLSPKIQAAAEDLKSRLLNVVGTIEIEGVPAGASIVIDGRYRGEFPPPAPLRASAGNRLIRVYKEGSDPLGTRVEVIGNQRVVARPKSIAEGGRLRVTEQRGRALSVLVDGVEVGKTPWEGPLAVGEHTVVLQGAAARDECKTAEEPSRAALTPLELGTQPVTVPIQLRQLMSLSLVAEELGASIRVEPTPAGASVAIDSVSVGRGTWEGKVRVGAHTVEVAAEGFIAEKRQIEIQRGKRVVLAISLQRDPSSPFWRKPPRKPRFIAEISAGVPISPDFGGDIANNCAGACEKGVGVGFLGSLRGGYELSSGFGFGVSAGYLSVSQTTSDRVMTLSPINLEPADPTLGPNPGTASDTVFIKGAALGAWSGLSLGERYLLHLRLGAGFVLGSIADTRAGRFTADTQADLSAATYYDVGPIGVSSGASLFFVAPEVRAGLRLSDHLEITAGIEVMALISLVQPTWSDQKEVNAEKAGIGTFAAETLVGQSLFLVAPSVGARWDF